MSKLLLLYLTFVVSMVFLLPIETNTYDWFPFADMKLTIQTYLYFIFERVGLIILAYIIASESKEYRGAIWCFFILIVVDLVDYLMTYNSVWFHLSGFPVSMNVVKCVGFGLVILYEWIRTLLNK